MASWRVFRTWHRLFLLLSLLQLSYHTVTPFAISGNRRTRTSCDWNCNDNHSRDSEEELESVRSWKSTSVKAAEAEIVYRAPSLLDANAFLEVKKRTNGWHTLGIVGGPTKSIYHGVFRKDETTGLVDPYALGPSEYIRTMASAALCLSSVHDGDTNSNNKIDDRLEERQPQHERESLLQTAPLRFLHMGYGSGSLMRLLKQVIPKSHHEAIELDPTVVEASAELGLFDPASACERVVVGDALEQHHRCRHQTESIRFRGVCIDVFDGANLMPSGFYAIPFLEKLQEEVLEREGSAFVVHNFHVGSERLETQLQDAMTAYRTVFGSSCTETDDDQHEQPQHDGLQSLYRVDSLNTNNHGGNTILIAILQNTTNDDAATRSSLLELAALATERWEFKRFDVASRIKHARPF